MKTVFRCANVFPHGSGHDGDSVVVALHLGAFPGLASALDAGCSLRRAYMLQDVTSGCFMRMLFFPM